MKFALLTVVEYNNRPGLPVGGFSFMNDNRYDTAEEARNILNLMVLRHPPQFPHRDLAAYKQYVVVTP